jgi:hypothetical protein
MQPYDALENPSTCVNAVVQHLKGVEDDHRGREHNTASSG